MERPSSHEVRAELDRVKHGKMYRSTLKSTIYVLVTVAAFAILALRHLRSRRRSPEDLPGKPGAE